jgi:hypothetical protein
MDEVFLIRDNKDCTIIALWIFFLHEDQVTEYPLIKKNICNHVKMLASNIISKRKEPAML